MSEPLSPRNNCVCPDDGYSPECPMARGGLGHVKACPQDGDPCPCLPGSISEAHCYAANARDVLDQQDEWELGGALIWHNRKDPRRKVSDQMVDAMRTSRWLA